MIKKIYLDMDGVLCDFEKRFEEINFIAASKVKGTFVKSEYWKKFVEDKHFSTLDWYPGGLDLWMHLSSFDIHMEILSSSGGEVYYSSISEQKKSWLKKNNIHIPANIVTSKLHKKDYAHEHHLLIDDSDKNVKQFIEAGGKAILHKDFETTKLQLDDILKR